MTKRKRAKQKRKKAVFFTLVQIKELEKRGNKFGGWGDEGEGKKKPSSKWMGAKHGIVEIWRQKENAERKEKKMRGLEGRMSIRWEAQKP
jgi:hypothetical protein